MNDLKQTTAFKATGNSARPQVVYVVPSAKVIDQFARQVCSHLEKEGKGVFHDPEIVDGFAAFLNFVAQATARQLNRKAGVKV